MLNVETKLENILAACEFRFKCIFDDTNARGFCGTVPAHFFFGHRNITTEHRNAEFEVKQIRVWQKPCEMAYMNSVLGGLSNYNELIESQLFDSTEFTGNRTRTDIRGEERVQCFRSTEEALHTHCSTGIHDMIVGLPLKCTGEGSFSDECYGKGILKELIDRFHLSTEAPDWSWQVK